ncbi:hypothetical protein T484DRAFT_2383612 [Baffinella frigidus]|nr:hypothetical protein T484DRAFT_2383612 [Cryptophyta sp. CCMP2293]
MLLALADGPELDGDELARKLAEAKGWAAQRLSKAESDAVRTKEDAKKEKRQRSRLQNEAVEGEMAWLKNPAALAQSDATLPKWLQDFSGIS